MTKQCFKDKGRKRLFHIVTEKALASQEYAIYIFSYPFWLCGNIESKFILMASISSLDIPCTHVHRISFYILSTLWKTGGYAMVHFNSIQSHHKSQKY